MVSPATRSSRHSSPECDLWMIYFIPSRIFGSAPVSAYRTQKFAVTSRALLEQELPRHSTLFHCTRPNFISYVLFRERWIDYVQRDRMVARGEQVAMDIFSFFHFSWLFPTRPISIVEPFAMCIHLDDLWTCFVERRVRWFSSGFSHVPDCYLTPSGTVPLSILLLLLLFCFLSNSRLSKVTKSI